jgi:hypothetical protein
VKRNEKVTWHEKHGLLFREFSMSDGKVASQLVIPQKFREDVIRIAHNSFLAGHLGIQRTVIKAISAFFCPGVQGDVRRYCQSCDIL